jgi:hypothetical protein
MRQYGRNIPDKAQFREEKKSLEITCRGERNQPKLANCLLNKEGENSSITEREIQMGRIVPNYAGIGGQEMYARTCTI